MDSSWYELELIDVRFILPSLSLYIIFSSCCTAIFIVFLRRRRLFFSCSLRTLAERESDEYAIFNPVSMRTFQVLVASYRLYSFCFSLFLLFRMGGNDWFDIMFSIHIEIDKLNLKCCWHKRNLANTFRMRVKQTFDAFPFSLGMKNDDKLRTKTTTKNRLTITGLVWC